MMETSKQTVFSLVLLLALCGSDAADGTTHAALRTSSSNQGLEGQVDPEVRRLPEKKKDSGVYYDKKGKKDKLVKDDDSDSDKGKGKKEESDDDYSKGKGKGKKNYEDYSKGKGKGGGKKEEYPEEEEYAKGGGKKSGSGGGEQVCGANTVLEPPLPGVMPGKDRPKLHFAIDVDYPPYAQLGPAEEDKPLSGFGADFARGLEMVCDVDVEIVQTQWNRCWSDDRIGPGLASGEYHGCATYTHASGVRNRYLEFSHAILNDNKAAGVLARLDGNGNPVNVDGNSNLSGLRVVDVKDFAPTAENLALLNNHCTNEPFTGYTFVKPDEETDLPNDDALRTLLAGNADAMFVYADQAERFSCANTAEETPWDCDLWDGLGTEFAYIHTGHFEWYRNGTTLSIAKKGAGLADIVNPCIQSLMGTEFYYDLCEKYDFVDGCYANEFFPDDQQIVETAIYDLPTNELPGDCSSGYCPCP